MDKYSFTPEKSDKLSNTEIKKMIRTTKRELFRNIPSIIAWMIMIVVVLMTFADFKFSNVISVGFAAKSVAFILLSYLMYYIEKSIGKSTGVLDETYKEKKALHEEKSQRIAEISDKDALPDFCAEWAVWEQQKAQRRILSGTGITYEEWERFSTLGRLAALTTLTKKKLDKMYKKEKLSDKDLELINELKSMPSGKRVAAVKACLIEKRALSPYDIIAESGNKEGRDPKPVQLKKLDRRHDVESLVPLTVMMAGMLLIVPEVVSADFSLKTLIYGLMRATSMLFTAFKGNYNGETLYTVDAVENLTLQCQMLDLYEKWKKKKNENSSEENAEEGCATEEPEEMENKAEEEIEIPVFDSAKILS